MFDRPRGRKERQTGRLTPANGRADFRVGSRQGDRKSTEARRVVRGGGDRVSGSPGPYPRGSGPFDVRAGEILIGHSAHGSLLLVAFTDRQGMKKARKAIPEPSEDLRSEYSFDYSKAKKNPCAAGLKGRTVAVVLEPGVAAAFPTSKAVNQQLRAVVRAVPRRARIALPRRGGRTGL